MINFDNTKENIKEPNPNSPEIPDHPYGILIVEGLGIWKTNALLNLINNEPDINKIYLYAKDLNEAKYKFLMKNMKILEQSNLMILNLLQNTHMIWVIFIKILQNIIQVRNVKY